MSLIPKVLTGGNNALQVTADDINFTQTQMLNPGISPAGSIGLTTNTKTGDFAVIAKTTMTVTIKAGTIFMLATPTGGSQRMYPVVLSADKDLVIGSNTGAIRYDKIYVTLPAASLLNPPANGDFTETACILAERHNNAGEALTATNAIEIAEITLSDGVTTVADTAITDKRVFATPKMSSGWDRAPGTFTYTSATRIATSVDLTNFLRIGTPIEYIQGGVKKYGYVAPTITSTYFDITGGTDYTVANAAITSLRFSNSSNPVGFPANSATFSPIGVNYAEVNANQASITTIVDLTGLSITVSVPTGKRIRITGKCGFQSGLTNFSPNLNINDGATKLNRWQATCPSVSVNYTAFVQHILTPTAGTHTYKLTAESDKSTTMVADGNAGVAYILAETI